MEAKISQGPGGMQDLVSVMKVEHVENEGPREDPWIYWFRWNLVGPLNDMVGREKCIREEKT